MLSDVSFFITMFSPRSVRFGTDSSQGLAAAVQLNQYLEENAIIQLDQKAGKDQGKFQVKTNIKVYKIYYIFFAGELQEA